jgi:hypothetical protein
LLTLLTGVEATNTTEFLFDIQESGGHGIGEALGLAGFTNLDVVRNPSISKAPYVARLMWHQIIPLSHEKYSAERTPLSLFTELPLRRLEIRVGKFSMVDFFDLNAYGSDNNFQFMNWTLDNNGAYDYAADTRGYTYAAMVEYDDRHWAVRFAEALMPKVANGINLDAFPHDIMRYAVVVTYNGKCFDVPVISRPTGQRSTGLSARRPAMAAGMASDEPYPRCCQGTGCKCYKSLQPLDVNWLQVFLIGPSS